MAYIGNLPAANFAGNVFTQQFSGNGVTVAFELNDIPISVEHVDLFIGGVYQNKNTFSVNGNVLTCSEAPIVGVGNVEVKIFEVLPIGVTDAALVSYTPTDTLTSNNVQNAISEIVSDLSASNGATLIGANAYKTQNDINDRDIYVADFGAVGDGITNDSPSFLLAKTAVPFGGTLHLEPNKSYLLNSPVNLETIGCLDGHGSTVKFSSTNIAANQYGIQLGKLVTTYTGFTSVLTVANTTHFAIPTGVSLVAGDLICMRSTDLRYAPDVYYHGMFALVTNVSSGIATISTAFYGAFNITSIEKYSCPIGSSVKNLVFDQTESLVTHYQNFSGLMIYGASLSVSHCQFKGNQYAHTAITVIGDGANVSNCHIDSYLNIQGLPNPGRVGYGVNMQANNTVVTNCHITACKHATTTGPHNFVVTGLEVTGNYLADDVINGVLHNYTGTVDTHDNVSGRIIVTNNQIISYSQTFLLRNSKALIQGNTIIQSGFVTQVIRGHAEYGLNGIQFVNNRVFMAGDGSSIIGTYSTDTAASIISNVIIDNNELFNGDSIRIRGQNTVASNISVNGNLSVGSFEFLGCSSSLASTNISFMNITVDNNILTDVRVLANVLLNTTIPVNSIKIRNNKVTALVSSTAYDCIIVRSLTLKTTTFNDLVIYNNQIDYGNNTGTLYCVQVKNGVFNNTKINNNKLFRVNSTRSLGISNADYTNLEVNGNICDGTIILTTSDSASSIIGGDIAGNKALSIQQLEGSFDFVLSKVTISTNRLTTQIFFSNRSGSTAWTSGGEVLVFGNTTLSTTDNSIYIDTNSTGHKIRTYGNNLGFKPADQSGTYYKIPIGNSIITGADQTWKGSTIVGIDGVLRKSAAPVAGTWIVGDRVVNSVPTVGQPKAWICTVAGTPGTWVSEGNL